MRLFSLVLTITTFLCISSISSAQPTSVAPVASVPLVASAPLVSTPMTSTPHLAGHVMNANGEQVRTYGPVAHVLTTPFRMMRHGLKGIAQNPEQAASARSGGLFHRRHKPNTN